MIRTYNYTEIATQIVDDEEALKEYQHEKINGYTGRWSALEFVALEDATYYIYEHDFYGDETCYLVVKYVDEQPVSVYETYDNLLQCLEDEEIIEVIWDR